MGTYSLDEILLAWKTETLTTEQAVGQILQLIQDLQRRVAALELMTPPSRVPIDRAHTRGAEKA